MNETELSPIKADWEYIAAVRVYLADTMTDSEGHTVPDLHARVNAYFDLGWLQDRLEHSVGECRHVISEDERNSEICRQTSVAFCHSCGIELCLKHLERKGTETVCEACL